MPTIVCVGESHVHALQQGLDVAASSGDPIKLFSFQLLDEKFRPGFVARDGRFVFNQQFDDEFSRCTEEHPPSVMFTYLGGSEHVLLGLSAGPRPFDIVFPGDEDSSVADNREVIPFDLFARVCRARIAWTPWLSYFQERLRVPIYQIGLPPPIGDAAPIAATAGPVFTTELAKYPVNPGRIRSRIWRACIRATKERCTEFGVSVLEPPAETIGSDGCLLPEYWGQDAVHANGRYGALLLRKMAEIVRLHERCSEP